MDEFTKIFMEGDAARSSTKSFVYRNPITGETQEGVGEPPMNWGEYPDGIDPNSPEGDEYDLNRGLFRPLPDALFEPGGLADIVDQPEGSQLDDPYWATASKILHDYMSPGLRGRNRARGVDREMSSEDYARYGVRFISSFENNLTAMAVNTAQLSNAPMPVHKAMYYLLETGDRDGILASNFGRDALNMASDPFNWVGLTTFGIGTAGKMAGQKLTKMAFRDLLKQMVISKPTAASAALGAEGAVYAAADNLARQNVAVEAGVQDAIDPTSVAAAGATGAVLGDRLGAGGAAVLEGGRRGIVKLGEGAQKRLDEAAGGTTLTSGVDPTKPIDQGLAAMGRAFDDAQARYFEQGNFEPPTAETPVSVVKPTEAEPGIIAFHGSGADFDEFRLEMIGTGEGAQAYGYGLYFTDSEDIANFYRQTVGGGTGIVDFSIGDLDLVRGGEFRDYSPGATPFGSDRRYRRVQSLTAEDYAQASMIEDIFINEGRLYKEIRKPGAGTIYEPKKDEELQQELIDIMYETLESKDPKDQPGEVEYIQNLINSVARGEATIKLDTKQYGKTYKVGLSPKPDELLDYDGPPSDAIKAKVLQALEGKFEPVKLPSGEYGIRYFNENVGAERTVIDVTFGTRRGAERLLNSTGAEILKIAEAIAGGRKQGAALLNDVGIPGIKYFSGDSRTTAGGELIDVSQGNDGFRAKVAVENRSIGGKGRVITTSPPYKTEQEALDWAEEATKRAERNYVIFDDKAVKILEKYGIAGPIAVTAVAGASNNDNDGGDSGDT